MAISTATFAVDDDPIVLLATGNASPVEVIVKNFGPDTVHLGGADVTTAQGFPLALNETMQLTLRQADLLYGVCAAASTAAVSVVRTRQ